jgi:hypothetical protein
MADQPEDLLQRLERLGKDGVGNYGMPICAEAAAELRRLVAENKLLHERHHFDNGVLKELLEAYRKMRNSAAGYSNFCDDNANTRRCERDFVAAEALYRAAIAKAEEQK